MKWSIIIIAFLTCMITKPVNAQDSTKIQTIESAVLIQVDNYRIYGDQSGLKIGLDDRLNGSGNIQLNGESQKIMFTNGVGRLDDFAKSGLNFIKTDHEQSLYHITAGSINRPVKVRKIPLWLSLVPPLIAIILALIFKEVIVSLIAGIWAGAFIVTGMEWNSLSSIFGSFFNVFDKYIIQSLSDGGHLSVIVFSLLIGAMVALISKNGGMMGVVNALSKYAKTPRSAQFITWLLGIAIFFDDYANTLIVGNTMKTVTDKFKISREKLAYIVDSTAAPVSAIAFITTWIGAELGYIGDGLEKLSLANDYTPYAIFIQSLKYSFYPILTLIFILILIKTQKDFGPMLKAERRASTTGQVSPAKTSSEDEPDMEDLTPVAGAPLKWQYAVFPILTVIGVTIFGLLVTGFGSIHASIEEANSAAASDSWAFLWSNMNILFENGEAGFFTKLGKLIGSSDSYIALLWASSSGLLVALIFTLGGRVMKLFDAMHWVVVGIKTMLPAIIILTLAWALAITTDELHTADFLSNALKDSLNPYLIPGVIFILAALIAFSTGSSWSTMAILYPIAIPTTYAICNAAQMPSDLSFEILLCVISTVLSASVLGDHVSPISDTTILSSLASDCNHIDHVKTQIPYALLVGGVSLILLSINILLGGGWLISVLMLGIGVITLYALVKIFGRKIAV